MDNVVRTCFFDQKEDAKLDQRNLHFWRALCGHIIADGSSLEYATILDIGCHRGGLLELLVRRFDVSRVIGIDPLSSARKAAALRLHRFHVDAEFYDSDSWQYVSDASVSLIVAHEVLQYIESLHAVMSQIKRVMRPGAFAYVVLGCHSENPLWQRWKADLITMGHTAYDHAPFDVMAAAADVGLNAALRPLRDTGWVYYTPQKDRVFTYPSAYELLEHQYRHKLLFRLENPL